MQYIMIFLAVLAFVLYFSPDTLLNVAPENDIFQKIKDNSKLVALACATGAGYLYYTNIQHSLVSESPNIDPTDLPSYEQSMSSNTTSQR
jgi:hypothetical protein